MEVCGKAQPSIIGIDLHEKSGLRNLHEVKFKITYR